MSREWEAPQAPTKGDFVFDDDEACASIRIFSRPRRPDFGFDCFGAAGQSVSHNVSLQTFETRAEPDGVVRLDKFVVGTSREMDGAAIAINEQRFAADMMATSMGSVR